MKIKLSLDTRHKIIQNNVIYYFISNKKVNGTLFYCFEHFVFANKYIDTTLTIFDATEADIEFIKSIFKERYNFDHKLLDKIVLLKKRTDLQKTVYHKSLFLDMRTFRELYMFTNNTSKEILCYSNNTHDNVRSNRQNITYYGSYNEYQVYDKESYLKLNFDIFKSILASADAALISSPQISDINTIVNGMGITEEVVLSKQNNISHTKLFESFSALYYYHSGRDKNNRLIPESYFYNKKVVVQYNNNYNDSIYYRNEDIKKNGLGNYWLSEGDVMLQDFII